MSSISYSWSASTGFSYAGRKAEVEALLTEPREELKRNWPAGKSDVTIQGKTEIDTFTFQDTTIGEAFRSDWYFVSNDMELLRHTVDIAVQGLGEKSIGASDLYRKSTARLPADGEAVIFAQLGTLTDDRPHTVKVFTGTDERDRDEFDTGCGDRLGEHEIFRCRGRQS